MATGKLEQSKQEEVRDSPAAIYGERLEELRRLKAKEQQVDRVLAYTKLELLILLGCE